MPLARKLRDDAYKVTSGQPMRWIMVGELGLCHPDTAMAPLDAALALAIEKDWMTEPWCVRTSTPRR